MEDKLFNGKATMRLAGKDLNLYVVLNRNELQDKTLSSEAVKQYELDGTVIVDTVDDVIVGVELLASLPKPGK